MNEKSPKTQIEGQPPKGARLFEVVIAGVPLRLKSSADAETVGELVSLVDRKVREALPLTKTGSVQNAAILASLHLAEEILMLKRKARAEMDRLEAKTLKVISELESSRLPGLSRTDGTENETNNAASPEVTESPL